MTLANSLPPDHDSDFKCVLRSPDVRCVFNAYYNSPVILFPCRRNEIEAARGNCCVTIQRLAFERSKENSPDEIALSLGHYPNETIYFNCAGRAVPFLGIAQSRLLRVRI